MADVLLTRGSAKNAVTNEKVESLSEANDLLSQCCGVRCCPGQQALRLGDRTTGITHELFFNNGGFFVRIFDSTGAIVSTTQLV